MRLLRGLAKDEGATVLIVSHDERLREIADRVLWLEDGQFKELAGLVIDPVCGMRLEPSKAVTIERQGETLYFCAEGCLQQFEAQQVPAPGD